MLSTTMTSFDPARLAAQVQEILQQNQAQTRLDGWFYTQEIRMRARQALRAAEPELPRPVVQARLFAAVCRDLPLSIRPGEVLAGTQADAFARTYALINPEFRVETFAGYCDPMAVYNDIAPTPESGLSAERIRCVRDFWAQEEFARTLGAVYADTGPEVAEVAYFVEQVTGHTIADFRPALEHGLLALRARAEAALTEATGDRRDFFRATVIALDAAMHLAGRYAALAETLARETADPARRADLERIAAACRRVPREGARNLYEAIQSFMLLWMAMTLEQAPNPYAFSVGNLDRLLQPYYSQTPANRETAVELTRHLLTLFCVGDRNWAISQNIMVGGRDARGNDLTCDMTTVVLEAFYRSNTPQPAISVKLHAGTPDCVYQAMEPFFTTPGSVTPSLFNDDVLFNVLRRKGIAEDDLTNYAIAGCQEPLIAGRESGNTTNSWLNLAKVLELAIHGGVSAISGVRIGLDYAALGLDPANPLGDPARLRAAFWRQLDHLLPRMAAAANGCTTALALLPVPFLSCFMGGLESGRDLRDVAALGTAYNASGCLIHGLSVVADSFAALDALHAEHPELLAALPAALRRDFAGDGRLHGLLLAAPKYGNDDPRADRHAAEIAHAVSQRVHALRNPWGNPFLPDWSTPSTHLLYGYWVGATPDGRRSRASLGYGIDPTPGMATRGLPPRIMSMQNLPYGEFLGGYASHIGLDRKQMANFGPHGFMPALRRGVLNPLFGYTGGLTGGYYVYLNVDTAKHLRQILANPKQLVPSGIYIMRIHGTFVNFLDLSPAIQQDIITRLDPDSAGFAA